MPLFWLILPTIDKFNTQKNEAFLVFFALPGSPYEMKLHRDVKGCFDPGLDWP